MLTLQQFRSDEEALGQDLMFMLSCFGKNETHLPMTIWIEVKRSEDDRRTPMVRFADNTSGSFVYDDDDVIPISISEDPRILVTDFDLKISDSDLGKLRRWIIAHIDPLLRHWHGEIDTIGFYRKMIENSNNGYQ